MNRPCHLILALTLLATAPALADDLKPPEYRFKPLSTVAGWDFLMNQEPHLIRPDDPGVPLRVGDAADPLQELFPDEGPFPMAAIFGDVIYTPAHGGGYMGGSFGDGGLVFVVPGWLDTFPDERLRLQVTYMGEEPPTTVNGFARIPGNSQDIKELALVHVPIQDPSLPAGSSFFYEDWLLAPSVTWQQVVVFLPAETIVLQVVIDTVSEPLSIFDDGFEPGDFDRWLPRKH